MSTAHSAVLADIAGPARSFSAKSLGAMLLLAIMWGLSIPITKLGLETIPPLTLTAMRFLVAVPLFLVLAAGRLRVPWRAVPSIIALGVMGITLGNVAQSFGVQGTSASVGTILSATIPIFIVIFAAIRLKQPVAGQQWIGLLAAFAGIALVAAGSGSGVDDLSRTTVAGVIWMLVSAVAIAFYYIWSAELTETYGTLPVAAWNALAGLVAILPLAGWEMAHEPIQVTMQAVWATISRRHGNSRRPAVVAVSAARGSGPGSGERPVSPAGVRDCRRVSSLWRPARADVRGGRGPDPGRSRLGGRQQATGPGGSGDPCVIPERLAVPEIAVE